MGTQHFLSELKPHCFYSTIASQTDVCMKPAPFQYFAPETLDEALALAAEYADEMKLLAGGQSLIPVMNFRLVQPTIIVDLNNLSELSHVSKENGELRIGAMVRQSAIEKDGAIAGLNPLLAAAMPLIAHPQIRNRGTIGGSIAHADPAAELPVIAVASEAKLKATSVRGDRWIDAKDFFTDLFQVDLAEDELLTEVVFPKWPEQTGWSFHEVARRHGDYALAGVAARVSADSQGTCTAAKLVYLSVGTRPVNASKATSLLVGQKFSPELVNEAAHIASTEEIDPGGNVHASADYQRHLVNVLTRKALTEAFSRTS